MRIVVEATAACRPNRTGIARYTISLIDALLARGADVSIGYRLSRWKRRWHRYRPPGVRCLWIQEPWLPLGRGCEVVHGTDARVPGWRGAARVATLHDVFSLLFTEFATEPFRRKKQTAYRRLAKTCDRIVCVSGATRDDFLRFTDFPPERIDVVWEGVDDAFDVRDPDDIARALRPYALPKRFILYVGDISARKNIPGIVRGFAEADIDPEVHLVLAGTLSHGAREALEVLRAIDPSARQRVHLTGYMPQDALPFLYAGAETFCFPTYYEGFGLPVLEAFASGVPVVGGNVGAVPEIAGGHAVLVDPKEPAAIAAGIADALARTTDQREAARLHARTFTWSRCAEETLAVYERAVAARV